MNQAIDDQVVVCDVKQLSVGYEWDVRFLDHSMVTRLKVVSITMVVGGGQLGSHE